MNQTVITKTAADLTSYKRDLLWAVYRANQAHETPVGADVKRELEALGQTNTQGGQFYPRLNELVADDFVAKSDHPTDERGFKCELTDEGRAVIAELVVRIAESLDMAIPVDDLPETDVYTPRRRETPSQSPQDHTERQVVRRE